MVHRVLGAPGRPLDPPLRSELEQRFGHDFARVRIHSGELAARSAQAVQASAYTVGHDVVLGAGQSAASAAGRRVLMHELAHVVQNAAAPAGAGGLTVGAADDPAEHAADQAAEAAGRVTLAPPAPQRGTAGTAVQETSPGPPAPRPAAPALRRQPEGSSGVDPDMIAERQYGDKPAPKAQNCGRPAHCPGGFCSPYQSQPLAEYYRAKNGGWIMAGIAVAVDSKVVPLWREYLNGGSPPKNFTADFGPDFTASPTTRETTQFLHQKLEAKLKSAIPFVPRSRSISVPIRPLIPAALRTLADPTDSRRMNFSVPRDIPGNLAGDIGTDQTSCPAGAQPSPFNDDRQADGTVELTRGRGREVTATPKITYTVKDTIDLCPGDCGALAEQLATIPLSQFEATGISGDIPFTVTFPAPSLGSFPLSALEGPDPSPPPPVSPPPAPGPSPPVPGP